MNFTFVVAFKVWITRIKRDPKIDFQVTESTKVCSEYFTLEDLISSFFVFMDFPNARKVFTFKEMKTSGRARISSS